MQWMRRHHVLLSGTSEAGLGQPKILVSAPFESNSLRSSAFVLDFNSLRLIQPRHYPGARTIARRLELRRRRDRSLLRWK